jgi:hypothetical protein
MREDMSPPNPGTSNIPHNTTNHDKAPPPSYRLSTHDSTSLDIPQRIEQKLAQYNTSQNVFKRWIFEIISWTTSAICMVCPFYTFVLLSYYILG